MNYFTMYRSFTGLWATEFQYHKVFVTSYELLFASYELLFTSHELLFGSNELLIKFQLNRSFGSGIIAKSILPLFSI